MTTFAVLAVGVGVSDQPCARMWPVSEPEFSTEFAGSATVRWLPGPPYTVPGCRPSRAHWWWPDGGAGSAGFVSASARQGPAMGVPAMGVLAGGVLAGGVLAGGVLLAEPQDSGQVEPGGVLSGVGGSVGAAIGGRE